MPNDILVLQGLPKPDPNLLFTALGFAPQKPKKKGK